MSFVVAELCYVFIDTVALLRRDVSHPRDIPCMFPRICWRLTPRLCSDSVPGLASKHPLGTIWSALRHGEEA